MANRMRKKAKKVSISNIVIILILILVMVAFVYFTGLWEKILDFNNSQTENSLEDNSINSNNNSSNNSTGNNESNQLLTTAGGHTTTVETLKPMKITFLDVGQGDCIIIELPDGKNMIIDSCEKSKAKDAITNYTTTNNITTFDYLLLTHQDADHCGNMSWVVDNYDINYIFRPNNKSSHKNAKDLPEDFNCGAGYISTSAGYANFLVSAYNEGCVVEAFCKDSDFSNEIVYNNQTYSYTFDFLTPVAERNEINYNDANNYSPIMMLEYMDKRIMFNGDAEIKNLGEYVSTYGNINNVDVLKVGHHGSDNATTKEYIDAIDPEYAIIQCGLGNKYKHPIPSVLDILNNHDGGVEIYRNDTNGNICLNISIDVFEFTFDNDDMSNNNLGGEELASLLNVQVKVTQIGLYYDNKKVFAM